MANLIQASACAHKAASADDTRSIEEGVLAAERASAITEADVCAAVAACTFTAREASSKSSGMQGRELHKHSATSVSADSISDTAQCMHSMPVVNLLYMLEACRLCKDCIINRNILTGA